MKMNEPPARAAGVMHENGESEFRVFHLLIDPASKEHFRDRREDFVDSTPRGSVRLLAE